MIYEDYKRNHVILPGREKALEAFLKKDYKGMQQHKWKHRLNSNSEDALTWSCFDVLAHLPSQKKIAVLNEMVEDAYQGENKLSFEKGQSKKDQIKIHIGKDYTGHTSNESTEVDASIEVPGKLIFFEAKLYSSVSLPEPPGKPHDQIARKLRIGLDNPLGDKREFFFIFLDIAPYDTLYQGKSKAEVLSLKQKGFKTKYKSAWLYKYYKFGRNNSMKPLKKALEGIDTPPVQTVADNMGWLTWSDLYKSILKEVIT